MKKYLYVITFGLLLGCKEKAPLATFEVTNPSDVERSEILSLDVSDINLSLDQKIAVMSSSNSLDFELIDDDEDSIADRMLAEVKLKPAETITLSLVETEVENKTEKRTQAEISIKEGGEWQEREYIGGTFKNVSSLVVPPEHTDHSWFIRYEGPGWESDKVGYRFYLDWRNGIDIFGKTTDKMALQNVGQDGFDSYHEPADWGQDILKVGPSLGLGSIGRYLEDSLYRFQQVDQVNCEIVQNGKLKSKIRTTYDNWVTETDTVSLISDISIKAGERKSTHKVSLSSPLEGFCTGLVIGKDEEYIDISEGDYRVIATYGINSLTNDKLGMALILKQSDIEKVFDDAYSHVVVFKPTIADLSYSFLAAWEKEPNGIKDIDGFKEYLNKELKKLANPVSVK